MKYEQDAKGEESTAHATVEVDLQFSETTRLDMVQDINMSP